MSSVRVRAVCLLSGIMVAAVLTLGAQDSPFVGRWQYVAPSLPTADLPRPPDGRRPPRLSGAFGAEFEFAIDTGQLVLIRTVGTATLRTMYKLDGSDSLNDEGPAKTISRVSVKGSVLTLSTWIAENGAVAGQELRRVATLQADGALVIDMTSGGTTSTSTYRRKP